ncbi:MAG: NAD-dependent deacetylase [Vulcanimicrobiota bacterium]
MNPIRIEDYSKIVFLTGAGISVASGLRPYRGPGGIWNEQELASRATAAALHQDPVASWQTFAPLRQRAAAAKPNAAHQAIADFQARDHSCWVCVLTQNVDGLHQRAGTTGVFEMHGSIHRTRCLDPTCPQKPFEDDYCDLNQPPGCPTCGGLCRFDVVLFDEYLPPVAPMALRVAMEDCQLFIAVGTSGLVMPAAGLVHQARDQGARTILVNLEAHEAQNPDFDEVYLGRAEELLPALLGCGV